MGRMVSTPLLILLGVTLALAGPVAGDMQAAYSVDPEVQ
jgi:hypothetical protein